MDDFLKNFPTFRWFSKSNKKGFEYDDARNYEDLVKFVEDNSDVLKDAGSTKIDGTDTTIQDEL